MKFGHDITANIPPDHIRPEICNIWGVQCVLSKLHIVCGKEKNRRLLCKLNCYNDI